MHLGFLSPAARVLLGRGLKCTMVSTSAAWLVRQAGGRASVSARKEDYLGALWLRVDTGTLVPVAVVPCAGAPVAAGVPWVVTVVVCVGPCCGMPTCIFCCSSARMDCSVRALSA